MFIKIDDWMFAKVFQPISDWLIARNGKGPHTLAATCGYMFAALILVENIYFPSESWFGMVWDILLILVVLHMAHSHDEEEKNNNIASGRLTLNQYRTSKIFIFIRIIGLPLCFLSLKDFFTDEVDSMEDLLSFATTFVLTCFFYFEACETKPPPPPKRNEKLVPARSRS